MIFVCVVGRQKYFFCKGYKFNSYGMPCQNAKSDQDVLNQWLTANQLVTNISKQCK